MSNALARFKAEVMEGLGNGIAIKSIDPGKKSKDICKEKMGNFGARVSVFDGRPTFILDFSIYVS